jgi:hypothetical protein
VPPRLRHTLSDLLERLNDLTRAMCSIEHELENGQASNKASRPLVIGRFG